MSESKKATPAKQNLPCQGEEELRTAADNRDMEVCEGLSHLRRNRGLLRNIGECVYLWGAHLGNHESRQGFIHR